MVYYNSLMLEFIVLFLINSLYIYLFFVSITVYLKVRFSSLDWTYILNVWSYFAFATTFILIIDIYLWLIVVSWIFMLSIIKSIRKVEFKVFFESFIIFLVITFIFRFIYVFIFDYFELNSYFFVDNIDKVIYCVFLPFFIINSFIYILNKIISKIEFNIPVISCIFFYFNIVLHILVILIIILNIFEYVWWGFSLLLFNIINCCYFIVNICKEIIIINKNKLLSVRNDYYKSYAEEIRNYSFEIRGLIHDFDNHILIISSMLNNMEIELLKQYVDKLHQYKKLVHVKTGNVIIDGLLNDKIKKALELDINIVHDVYLFSDLKVDDLDLVIILGNILDNAIKATYDLPKEDRYIDINIKYLYGGIFCIDIANSYNGELSRLNIDNIEIHNKYTDMHGIGLNNVVRIVSKNKGFFEINLEKHLFKIKIILYDK